MLRNPLVGDTIIQRAGLKATDIVLEVGTGTGNLTMKLLETAKKVIAIEIDPKMIVEMTKRVMGTELENKLVLINGDALKTEWPAFDVFVANIPYQISSPLIFKLLAHRPMFRCALLMLQREFALRMVAKPGDSIYSRLSVNTQLLSRVSHVMKVSRNSFRPPPKVDSSVIRLDPINPPPPIDFAEWDGLLRICFMRKNKTLGALFRLSNVLAMLKDNYNLLSSDGDSLMDVKETKEKVIGILESEGFVELRSQKLTNDDFLK